MSDDIVAEAELPLESAGSQLVRAREAAGLPLARVSAITRIPERLLEAIEQGNYAALPARTYAIGFARNYAKAVGIDHNAIVAAVRTELAAGAPEEPRRTVQTFEPGDPARIPSARLAWVAGLGLLAVLVIGLIFWRNFFAPAGELPSILPSEAPSAAVAPAPVPAAAPSATGPVVFTALQQGVWVKFVDGAGNQLLQKELALGESYTVPPQLPDVKLTTVMPDQLGVTIGGQPVAKLAERQGRIKDVPVTASALLARSAGPAAAVAAPAAPVAPEQRAAAPARQERRATAPARTARPDQPVVAPQQEAAPVVQGAAPVPAAT